MIMMMYLLCGMASAQLFVKKPESLLTQLESKTISFNVADFGFVPYGQQISGYIKQTTQDNIHGCDVQTVQESTEQNTHMTVNVILIVERGNCTFLQKAMVAQQDGVKLLIIVDDREEDIYSFDLVSANESVPVGIPVILIPRKQGLMILNHERTEEIKVVIKFPQLAKQEIVSYSYWFSVMDNSSYNFIEQFYPFHKNMSSSLNFTPHYALTSSAYARSKNWTVKVPQCVSGGRYCEIDPDGDGPLSGKDTVIQVLTQLCVFNESQTKWWEYVIGYRQSCLSAGDHANCVKQLMKNVSLNYDKVQKCMNESFEGTDWDLANNKILERENFTHFATSKHWPLLIINNVTYRGSLVQKSTPVQTTIGVKYVFDTINYGPLQTICRGFEESSLPKVCEQNLQVYIEDGKLNHHSAGSSTWLVWFLVILMLVLVMLVSMFFYKRMYRKEMNAKISEEVNIYMAQYYALNEKEKSTQQQQ